MMLPSSSSVSLFNAHGSSPLDSAILLYRMTEETRAMLAGEKPKNAAVALWQAFVADPQAYFDRFKGMANFLNPEEVELNFALRKLLIEYNMKPVLTRPQHSFHTDGRSYFEVDLDVHIFGYVARKGWATLKNLLPNAIFDVGVVVEVSVLHSPPPPKQRNNVSLRIRA